MKLDQCTHPETQKAEPSNRYIDIERDPEFDIITKCGVFGKLHEKPKYVILNRITRVVFRLDFILVMLVFIQIGMFLAILL